jgi:GTPase
VAVVGKPNVGKSSSREPALGEERVVVSEEAGTTRDPVDTPFSYHGQDAGLRRHRGPATAEQRVKDSLEYYSALRTERVVHEADVCLVLVDASEGSGARLQDVASPRPRGTPARA